MKTFRQHLVPMWNPASVREIIVTMTQPYLTPGGRVCDNLDQAFALAEALDEEARRERRHCNLAWQVEVWDRRPGGPNFPLTRHTGGAFEPIESEGPGV